MSLIIELFGPDILFASLTVVKNKIKNLQVDRTEKKSYLLKDFAAIKAIKLTSTDFKDIGV